MKETLATLNVLKGTFLTANVRKVPFRLHVGVRVEARRLQQPVGDHLGTGLRSCGGDPLAAHVCDSVDALLTSPPRTLEPDKLRSAHITVFPVTRERVIHPSFTRM